MNRKVPRITVVLEVQAVTCPGVWLCQNGNVSLHLEALGTTAKTHGLPPVFPILYHETFTFKKAFPSVKTLKELQRHLCRELLRAEFTQWPPSGHGIVLATFETSICELLFPQNLKNSTEVDLLMEATSKYPGILSPKIEISTKTTIDEALIKSNNSLKEKSNVAQDSEPKLKKYHARAPIYRQRKVCHSTAKHAKETNGKGNGPGLQMRKLLSGLKNMRTQGDNRGKEIIPNKTLVWSSASDDELAPTADKYHTGKCFDPDVSKYNCVCGHRGHQSFSCTICRRYLNYFDEAKDEGILKLAHLGSYGEGAGLRDDKAMAAIEESKKLSNKLRNNLDELLTCDYHYVFPTEKYFKPLPESVE